MAAVIVEEWMTLHGLATLGFRLLVFEVCRLAVWLYARQMQSVLCMPRPPAKEEKKLRCFCQDDIEAGDSITGAESSKENKQPGRKRITQDRVFLSLLQMFFFPFIFHFTFAKKKKKKEKKNNAQRTTHQIYNAGPRLHQSCSIRLIPPFHQEKPSGLCLCALRMQTRWGQLQVQSTLYLSL
ncbi:hypothetical protein I7I48_03818 [Histoplasma ohiense]|nr:hypothetical protein I7I48_03818 [Histoplasma ohiense (nom. inval.)]